MGLNFKIGDFVVEKGKTNPTMEIIGTPVSAGFPYKVKEEYFTCFWQDTIGRYQKEFQADELKIIQK